MIFDKSLITAICKDVLVKDLPIQGLMYLYIGWNFGSVEKY